jgi:putative nucleotidyltransferase with HDIG domain
MQKADLNYCKRWFNKYVAQFHLLPGDGIQPILLKEQHSMRTCKEIVLLGRELGLAQEDLLLAEAAALFHDIGRFPQWKYYSTFIDSESEDHALLGLEVISRHSVLQRIPPDKKEIILEAIRHHNLRELPTGLSPRQLLFSRLLRDTDKLDIWRMIIMQQRQRSNLLETLAGDIPSNTSYGRDIVAELNRGRSPDFSYVQNHNDMRLIRLGWVFDLNFAPSCRQVLERNYIEDLCSQLPANREIWELQEYLISYLKEHSSPEL